MKIKKIKISSLVVVVLSVFSLGTLVSALPILPDPILEILRLLGPGGVCSSVYITSRVQFILVVALGAIILVAVVYALLAAFKYVSSQGEAGKMEDAQKSIKAIFIGIAAMIIAIVGIILVFAIFGARPADPSLYQTCISDPTSKACENCKTAGGSGTECSTCEKAISDYCKSPTDSTFSKWEQIKPKLTPSGACD